MALFNLFSNEIKVVKSTKKASDKMNVREIAECVAYTMIMSAASLKGIKKIKAMPKVNVLNAPSGKTSIGEYVNNKGVINVYINNVVASAKKNNRSLVFVTAECIAHEATHFFQESLKEDHTSWKKLNYLAQPHEQEAFINSRKIANAYAEANGLEQAPNYTISKGLLALAA